MNDPYVYPGTEILINKLGIREQSLLDEAESIEFIYADQKPLPEGKLDFEHLKAIHHHFFGNLYPFAGEIRSIDMIKGESYFASHTYIESAAHSLFGKLAKENHLQQSEKSEFCERLAYYFSEINALHPFREGNGRAQRAFCNILAQKAGYKLDWSAVQTEAYIQASIQSFDGNYQSMADIFKTIAIPLEQGSARTQSEEIAVPADIKAYIELRATLSHLITQKNTYLVSNPKLADEYTEKALALSDKLPKLAKELMTQLQIQALCAKAAATRVTSVAELGGFAALHERAKQNKLTTQDIFAVCEMIQASAKSLSQTLNRTQKTGLITT